MSKNISGWDELKKVTSPTHTLDIEDCCGWIYPKEQEKIDKFEDCHYLSTHTFYSEFSESYTKLLQKCGFDVILLGWDE